MSIRHQRNIAISVLAGVALIGGFVFFDNKSPRMEERSEQGLVNAETGRQAEALNTGLTSLELADPNTDSPDSRQPVGDSTLSEDEEFDLEEIDSEWASRLESFIFAQIAASDLLLSGIEAECRSSACRVVLRHAAPARDRREMNEVNEKVVNLAKKWVEESAPNIVGQKTMLHPETMDPQSLYTSKVYLYRTLEFDGMLFCGPIGGGIALPPGLVEALQQTGQEALCQQRSN